VGAENGNAEKRSLEESYSKAGFDDICSGLEDDQRRCRKIITSSDPS